MEDKKDFLLEKFMRTFGLLHKYQHRYAAQEGYPGGAHRGQGRLLAMLGIKPGISQKELSYLLGMRSQSVGELLSKLEKSGYITRTPSEADRRAIDISLTEEGKKAVEETKKQRENIENAFNFLSENDKGQLDTLLSKVIDGLSAELGGDEAVFGFGFGAMDGPRGGHHGHHHLPNENMHGGHPHKCMGHGGRHNGQHGRPDEYAPGEHSNPHACKGRHSHGEHHHSHTPPDESITPAPPKSPDEV